MAAKKNLFVPLQSIIVTRPDPKSTDKNPLPDRQIDVLAEYKTTGKAFQFTQDEVDEITAGNDGNIALALREPSDEAGADEPVVVTPAASDTASDGTSTSEKGKATPPAKDTDL